MSVEQNVAAKGMPRRVVVKSAAWSLPVFAAVAVTPAFAASGSLASSSLLASRARQTYIVTFVWDFTFTGAGSPTIASAPQLPGLTTITSGPDVAGLQMTFSATTDGQSNIPGFTATVTLTNGLSQLFTVFGRKVNPNASSVPFTVN